MSRGHAEPREAASTRAATPVVRWRGLLATATVVGLLTTAAAPAWAATGTAQPPGGVTFRTGPAPVTDLLPAVPGLLVPGEGQVAAPVPTAPATPESPVSPTVTPGTDPTGEPTRPAGSGVPGPGRGPRLGVRVVTTDLLLTDGYWASGSAVAELSMTVTNTGQVAERIQLAYTLPASLRDTGARDCAAFDETFRCPPRRLEAGASSTFRTLIRITVDAWRRMPLTGTVVAEASAASGDTTGSASAERTFAVLFPAGPPTAGMALSAGEVDLVGRARVRGELDVRLGNTGDTDATGTVEAVLPAGFRVAEVPAGCRGTGSQQLRCDVGAVPAGQSRTIRLPVTAKSSVMARAPMAGVVVGVLDPVDGPPREMRTSFRVLRADQRTEGAPVSTAGPGLAGSLVSEGGPDAEPVATTSRAGQGWAQRLNPLTIILVVVAVCVLALALAVVSLRRRLGDEPDPDNRYPPH